MSVRTWNYNVDIKLFSFKGISKNSAKPRFRGWGVKSIYYCLCWASISHSSSYMKTSLRRGLNKATFDQVWFHSFYYWVSRGPLKLEQLSNWKEIFDKILWISAMCHYKTWFVVMNTAKMLLSIPNLCNVCSFWLLRWFISDLYEKYEHGNFGKLALTKKWHIGLCRKNVLGAAVLPKLFWSVSVYRTGKYEVWPWKSHVRNWPPRARTIRRSIYRGDVLNAAFLNADFLNAVKPKNPNVLLTRPLMFLTAAVWRRPSLVAPAISLSSSKEAETDSLQIKSVEKIPKFNMKTVIWRGLV